MTLAIQESPGQTLALDGVDLYFEIHGQGGDPLLLMHGFTGSGGDWRDVFGADLATGHSNILPDLRGHGRSTPLGDGTYHHRQAARDAFALLDHLEVRTCRAIGVSGGSLALLHMATQQPERIESMVLVAATPHYPPSARQIMAQTPLDGHGDEEWAQLRRRHVHGDDQIRALWRAIRAFADDHEDVDFGPELLSKVTARSLIVHGDRDPLYPVDMPLALYRHIPDAQLWIVPGAGHFPFTADDLGLFADTALGFIVGEAPAP